MTQRSKATDVLKAYFNEKGRVLSALEYSRETDTPIRYRVVINMFGSWPRMEKIVMARETPDAVTNVDDLIWERNNALVEGEKKFIAASENQEDKMKLEAQAHLVAEKLAANAATAAGANENKIAIGGPVVGEHPKYERSGATVNIDPKSGKRTIVDPDPELVDPLALGDKEDGIGETPEVIKARLAQDEDTANTGKVNSAKSDIGRGSDGAASVATAAAAAGSTTK